MGEQRWKRTDWLVIGAATVVAATAIGLVGVLTGRGPDMTADRPDRSASGPTSNSPRPTLARPQSVRPTTPTSQDRIRDRARRELTDGLIAYDPPNSTTVDEEFQVTARIQRGTATTQPSLQQLPGPGPVVHERLPVGTFLRADLDGANFEVELIGEELQPLLDQDIAEWAWKVRPLTAGQQRLRLTVSVVLEGEPLSARVFDRTIDVQVVPAPLWSRIVGWSGWGEILVGLVVAAITTGIGTAVARHRRRRPRPAVAREKEPEHHKAPASG